MVEINERRSMKIAFDFPYLSFCEWYYGLGMKTKRGLVGFLTLDEEA